MRNWVCFKLVTSLFLMTWLSCSTAEITVGGTGMLFGTDHAFNITAADGWVLDNESARQQGLHMLFYPKGEDWSDSPVIVYGRSTGRGPEKAGVKELVKDTVDDFHANGSAGYRALRAADVVIRGGKSVAVYHYQGDQWGNYEAGAYFVEEGTVNFLVYHARSEEIFTRYYPDFIAMIRSYNNAFLNINPSSDEEFSQLLLLAKQDVATPQGQEYERNAVEGLGRRMAEVAGGCASFFQPGEAKDFQVIFRITPLGKVADAYTNPANSMASCFVGLIGRRSYPPPPFDDFLLHLDMKFQ